MCVQGSAQLLLGAGQWVVSDWHQTMLPRPPPWSTATISCGPASLPRGLLPTAHISGEARPVAPLLVIIVRGKHVDDVAQGGSGRAD
jgi:hypothetical protein